MKTTIGINLIKGESNVNVNYLYIGNYLFCQTDSKGNFNDGRIRSRCICSCDSDFDIIKSVYIRKLDNFGIDLYLRQK